MTPLDRINIYAAHRYGLITKKERDTIINERVERLLSKNKEAARQDVRRAMNRCRKEGQNDNH